MPGPRHTSTTASAPIKAPGNFLKHSSISVGKPATLESTDCASVWWSVQRPILNVLTPLAYDPWSSSTHTRVGASTQYAGCLFTLARSPSGLSATMHGNDLAKIPAHAGILRSRFTLDTPQDATTVDAINHGLNTGSTQTPSVAWKG